MPLWLVDGWVPTLLLFLSLWLRPGRAAAEVGRPRKTAAPALWALVWYVVLMVCWPSSGLNPGWMLLLVMGYAFYRIVKSLLRAGTQLSDWGYAVRAAPVKIGGGKLAAAYLVSLVLLAAVLSLVSNHLPMEGPSSRTNVSNPLKPPPSDRPGGPGLPGGPAGPASE